MVREAHGGSDLLFRALIEHSPEVIVLITPDCTITYASPSNAHITGYTCEEVLCLENRWRCKDGTWRWIESTVTNLLDHPQVGAIMCISRDITKCKQLPVFEQAVRQLLDTERKFRSLVESTIVGVMVTDQEGRIYEVNDRLVHVSRATAGRNSSAGTLV